MMSVLSPHTAGLLLWVVAAVAAGAILGPALAFALFGPRLSKEVLADPALAEPPARDENYRRRFHQFVGLGFQALGTSIERCWFMSPIKLYWRSLQGNRWLGTSDGRTFASFHRLLPEEPVRFGAVTFFDDGSLVRTTCPGVLGATTERVRGYRRVELTGVEPERLLARHREEVEAFASERGVAVKPMTFAEAIAAEAFFSRQIVGRSGQSGYWFISTYFLLPAGLAYLFSGPGAPLHHPAAAICLGATVFAFFRMVVFTAARRRRALGRHTALR
jgi:hypothetical protein